jgi:Na+/H+-dicarboxylate symporter
MVPVVFVSLVLSLADVDDLKKFGRIGVKTFLCYCCLTVLAALVGITWVNIIQPGIGFQAVAAHEAAKRATPTVADTLLGIIPSNIIKAMVDAKLISIVFFSILFGIAIALLPKEKKEPLVVWFRSLNDAIMKLIKICLLYAPVGVFALMANMAGNYGVNAIKSLGRFLACDYIASLTQLIIIYGIVLAIGPHINVFKFISRVRRPLITAATTLSSAATVPVELEQCESYMGVPKKLGGFMFPFGATVNMNGSAILVTTCVLFSAQVYGVHFAPMELFMIILITLISAIGASGVPAASTVFVLMILSQFNISTEAFAVILGIYSVIDLSSTTLNICGDMVTAIFVTNSEGLLNKAVWAKGYRPQD